VRSARRPRWKLEFTFASASPHENRHRLGTTNSLSRGSIRKKRRRKFPAIHIFEVPQLVLPAKPNRAAAAVVHVPEDGRPVGVYAREQGALFPAPGHSAKSWLSNPDVDRTAKILPGSQETGRVLSPVEVVRGIPAAVPRGLGQAARNALADEDIVLTVPASFDKKP